MIWGGVLLKSECVVDYQANSTSVLVILLLLLLLLDWIPHVSDSSNCDGWLEQPQANDLCRDEQGYGQGWRVSVDK
jgi:hypothetical protein